MKQYQELLKDVLENGTVKGDRTGTGTRSVFGRQIRMDLSKGFPLLTTKKMFTKAILHELLWIISGDTNIEYLKDNGVKIWDDWRKPDTLNRDVILVEPRDAEDAIEFKGFDGQHLSDPCQLRKIWIGMLRRCYSPSSDKYKFYGAKGVTVSARWHTFENFEQDVKHIPNWFYKENNWDEYHLDKDYYGSNQYGKNTCVWLSSLENNQYTKAAVPVYVNGKLYTSISQAAEDNSIAISSLHRFISEGVPSTLKGNNSEFKGWGFSKYEGSDLVRLDLIEDGDLGPVYGKQWRGWSGSAGLNHDQLHDVIHRIKTNPDCRRMIVSAWNVDDIDSMALPPCHCLFQFYVADGKLSCQLYQRSADIFLGVPFNIASYAALTHMIAQVCDLEVGEFVHTFGDLHLYNNHVDQAYLQLERQPKPLPQLLLNPDVTDIDAFEYEDFVIQNYVSHPTIKGDVSV